MEIALKIRKRAARSEDDWSRYLWNKEAKQWKDKEEYNVGGGRNRVNVCISKNDNELDNIGSGHFPLAGCGTRYSPDIAMSESFVTDSLCFGPAASSNFYPEFVILSPVKLYVSTCKCLLRDFALFSLHFCWTRLLKVLVYFDMYTSWGSLTVNIAVSLFVSDVIPIVIK